MSTKLKQLGTDTAIYGISTVVGRLLTFLLTPLYTNVLPPSDLGIVATVYAYIAFLNILYGYGMETAFMRYTASLELGDKKQNFSVPFLSVAATSVLFTVAIGLFRDTLGALAHVPASHSSVVGYAAGILLLDALALIPFAHLRMERKAKYFAALKLFNIVLTVALNLVVLVNLRWGIEGIFIANLIASGATLALLLPVIFRNLSLRWQPALHRALLRFALPAVPSYLASMMIQVIDRPILEALTDKATVGVYQANYRLGIFMMLIVSTFDFAWRPFFLSNAAEPDARRLFARVLTYFFGLMVGCFLLISFFINDVVTLPIYHGRSLIAPEYWSGLSIVPIVLVAYIFLGISNTIVAGIYIEKRTAKLPIVTFIGAAVNIIANVLLIPPFGITGAAVATLLSYAVMAGVLYVIVQRVYPIEYEFGRMAKIAIAAAFVFLLFQLVQFPAANVLWKIGLLVLFGVLLYAMKVFSTDEISSLKHLFAKRSGEPPAAEL
jgi:O-antigen/teichoic acid export membrane protein